MIPEEEKQYHPIQLSVMEKNPWLNRAFLLHTPDKEVTAIAACDWVHFQGICYVLGISPLLLPPAALHDTQVSHTKQSAG